MWWFQCYSTINQLCSITLSIYCTLWCNHRLSRLYLVVIFEMSNSQPSQFHLVVFHLFFTRRHLSFSELISLTAQIFDSHFRNGWILLVQSYFCQRSIIISNILSSFSVRRYNIFLPNNLQWQNCDPYFAAEQYCYKCLQLLLVETLLVSFGSLFGIIASHLHSPLLFLCLLRPFIILLEFFASISIHPLIFASTRVFLMYIPSKTENHLPYQWIIHFTAMMRHKYSPSMIHVFTVLLHPIWHHIF